MRIFKMKTPIGIVVVLLAVAFAHKDRPWDDLHAKWVASASPEEDGFYPIPRTANAAKSQGWIKVKGISNLKVNAYCLPLDGRFCVLMDLNGFVAGFQIGLLANDVADLQNVFDLSKGDMFRKKKLFDDDYWTSTVYTVNPAIIQAGGRSKMNGLTGTEGVWLQTGNDYLVIPKKQSDLNPIWTEATCIDRMGTHFYFNSSKIQLCPNIKPLFLAFDHGQLISVGWFAYGDTTITKRSWFEKMPVQFIRLINPTGPECLYEGVKKYGLLSLHVSFVKKPWTISC